MKVRNASTNLVVVEVDSTTFSLSPGDSIDFGWLTNSAAVVSGVSYQDTSEIAHIVQVGDNGVWAATEANPFDLFLDGWFVGFFMAGVFGAIWTIKKTCVGRDALGD